MSYLSRIYWLSVCLLAVEVSAESATDGFHQLDKVQVSGTGADGILSHSPVRTMVISGDEIEKVHAKTLADALRYTSGVDVKPIGNDSESGSGISIQGLDPSQVLIMVDGNPVAPNSGEMLDVVDISQVLIGAVDRIEVVQGGASAIYGANAMGGVVNIITRTPDQKFKASADISAGDWGAKSNEHTVSKTSAILNASNRFGDFSTQLTANLLQQEGYDTNPEESGTDGWHGYKNNFVAKLQHHSAQGNVLTISPNIYRAETATYKLSQDIFKTKIEDKVIRERDTWDVSYQGMHQDLAFKLHTMDQSYSELIDGSVSRLDQASENQAFDLTLNKHFGYDHLFTLGLLHKYEYLSQYDLAKERFVVAKKEKRSSDLSISDNWFVGSGFELVPAIRLNEDEFYGAHVSPMLSAMYSNDDHWFDGKLNIRASIADGYKTPTLKQMYWEFDHGTLWEFGNADLIPEKSISTQLGFELLSNDNARYEINFFNNDTQNLIDTQSNPDRAAQLEGVSTVLEYVNVDKARMRGMDLSYKKSFQSLSFNLSYSYLDAVNLETGKLLPQKSKNQYQVGLSAFNFFNMSASLKYRFYGKQYVDSSNDEYVEGYGSLDFKFNQDISHELAWYLGVDNLLDNTAEQYATTGGHGSSGNDVFSNSPRYVYLGLRFKH